MTSDQPPPDLPAPSATAARRGAPVVVAGAGLSGLLAAHLLEQQGVDVMLVEARQRVGGRILGQGAAGAAHRVDLGPSWLWPDSNPNLADWLTALGLAVFEQHGFGASLVEMPGQPVHRHAGFAQQPPSMRVVGGTACLTDALRARLQRTQVLLGTRLRSLEAAPADTVRVGLESQGEVSTIDASALILALPPRLLASTLRWSPALPAELSRSWADAPTWMAGHAKLVASYATPFWRAAGLSGHAVSRVGPLVEIHDAGDAAGQQAALFGFVGVSASARRHAGRQALVDAALAQLARLFGAAALTPQAVHLQDWADEIDTATAADAQPAAAHPACLSTALPAPWRNRVHLAGSEFAPDFPGYLEGAALAARRAVDELMAQRAAGSVGNAAGSLAGP